MSDTVTAPRAPAATSAFTADTYDPQTGNLDTTVTQAGSTPVTVDDDVYHYNDAGQITAADDGGTGITPEDQCYAYNYAGELASAWSQDTTSCAATPSAAILGGAYPYWQQLTYDGTGNVTEADTTTGAPGEPGAQTVTSQSDSYPAPGSPGPHQLTSQQVTTGAGTTTTTSQSFNLAGQLTATTTGGGTQTSALTWNSAGQLTADTTTTPGTGAISTAGYIYDADGNLLLQADGSATTLYLGDEQITDADGTVSGTRYYTIGGQTVAARTSAGTISYLVGDQQGTSYLAIDADTLDATRHYDTPWGVSLQPDAPAFPGTRSFVGGTADPPTGLTNLGAREYNPAAGQFISTDPILDPGDPLDLNPYAYASNDPVNSSDPSGLYAEGPGTGGVTCTAASASSTACGGPGPAVSNDGICEVNISACMNAVWDTNGGNHTESGPTNGGYTPPANEPGTCSATTCTSVFGTTAKKPPAPKPATPATPARPAVKKVTAKTQVPVAPVACARFGTGCAGSPSAGSGLWNWVVNHKVAIGIGLGILSILAGGAGLVILSGFMVPALAGLAETGTLLSGVAVGAGIGAGVIDMPECSHHDSSACVGMGLGFAGAALGLPGVGAGYAIAGAEGGEAAEGAEDAEEAVTAEQLATTWWNYTALTLSAFSLQFAIFGTLGDALNAGSNDKG